MTKTIIISRREENTVNGKDILNIWDENDIRYTHFIEPRNEGWEEMLQEGNRIRVYATEKENPNNPKYPYRNIYKPLEQEDDEPMTDTGNQAPAQIRRIEEEARKGETEKSEQIRWMNSLNNACRLVQGQVIGVDNRNPMNSIVQLANVLYKLEPQR